MSITILGSGIVTEAPLSPNVRIGFTRGLGFRWTSDSSISAKASENSRHYQSLILSSPYRRAGSLSSSLTHDDSVASSIVLGNSPSTGSISVTIIGSNYQHTADRSQGSHISGSSCESTLWKAESAVQCKRTGTFRATAVCLTLSNFENSLTLSVSLDITRLSNGVRKNAPSSGAAMITLLGAGFGAVSKTLGASVGRSSGEVSLWASESSLVVKVGRTVSKSLLFVASSSVVLATLSQVVSFDGTSISSIQASNLPATGSVTALLVGRTMGAIIASHSLSFGRSSGRKTLWISETSVSGMPTHGRTFALSTLRVTSSRSVGSLTKWVTFAEGSPSSAGVVNVAATGGFSVTILGSLWGVFSMTARIGASSSETTQWNSVSSLLTKVVAGGRYCARILVSSDIKRATMTGVITFETSSVWSLATLSQNVPATGATTVTMVGRDFAKVAAGSFSLRLGGSGVVAIKWISDSSIRCKSSSGTSRRLCMASSLLRVGSSLSNALTFDAGSVVQGANSPSTGAKSITLHSVDLRPADPSCVVHLHGTAVEGLLWTSDSSVSCKPGSVGAVPPLKMGQIALTILERARTISLAWSFDLSEISSPARGSNGPTTGAILVTAMGTLLVSRADCAGATGSLRMGYSASAITRWVSSSVVLCKTVSGRAGRLEGVVLTLLQVRPVSHSNAFSYSTVSPSLVVVANLPRSGAVSVTVFGCNLGDVQSFVSPVTKLMDSTSAESSKWVSDTGAVCKATASPRTVATQRALVMTVAGPRAKIGSLIGVVSQDGVVVRSLVSFTNVASTGGQSITVVGRELGLTGGCRLGGTAAASPVYWISQTCIRSKVTRVGGGGFSDSALPYLVSIGGVSTLGTPSTVTVAVTMDVTVLVGLWSTQSNTAMTGSQSVTLVGASSSFGSVEAASPVARFSRTVSETSVWVSETAARIKRATGGFATTWPSGVLTVAASLVSEYGTVTALLSTDLVAPTMLTAPQFNIPSTGSRGVTIQGRMFSDVSAQATARLGLGGTSCELSTWLSESSVLCKGARALASSHNAKIAVTVGAASSSSNLVDLSNSVGSLTNAWSADLQLVLGTYSRPNASPTGGVLVTVIGMQLALACSVASKMTSTVCLGTSWGSESTIAAKSPSMVVSTAAPSTMFVVTANNAVAATRSTVISFEGGQASATVRGNIAHSGSISVTIVGGGLGATSVSTFSTAVRVSGSAAKATVWSSISSIRALSVPGWKYHSWDSSFAISVLPYKMAASSTLTSSFSYHLPKPSNAELVLPTSAATTTTDKPLSAAFGTVGLTGLPLTGEISVQISGLYSIGGGNTGSQRIGSSPTERTLWTSETSVQCVASRGLKDGLSVVVTAIFAAVATLTNRLTYSEHDLLGVPANLQNAPATGSRYVTLIGTLPAFSHTIRAKITSGSGSESSVWKTETSALCKLPRLSTMTLNARTGVMLTVIKNVKTVSGTISLDGVDIANTITKPASNVASTTGAISVTLIGSMVTKLITGSVLIGHSSCESSLWRSQSEVRTKIAASGYEISKLPLVVSVSSSKSGGAAFSSPASLKAAMSINSPMIFKNVTRSNTVITGSFSITVFGQNLASSVGSNTARHRVGTTAAEAVAWTSGTSMRAKAASGSYWNLNSVGDGILVLSIAVQVGSSLSRAVSYDRSIIKAASGGTRNGPMTGSYMVDVFAVSLGVSDYSANCRRASTFASMATGAEFSLWMSDTAASLKAGSSGLRGINMMDSVVVTTSRRFSFASSGTLTRSLSVDSIILMSSSSFYACTNVPTTGAVSVTLFNLDGSSSFVSASGSFATSLSAKLGKTSSTASLWISDSSVIIKTPSVAMRAAASVALTASALTEVVVMTSVLTQDVPTVSMVAEATLNAPTTGSTWVSVMTEGFGLLGMTVSARVGKTSSESAVWGSETSLKARVAAASGIALRLSASVLARKPSSAATASTLLSVDAPMMLLLDTAAAAAATFGSWVNVPSTGGLSVTVVNGMTGMSTGFRSPCSRVGLTATEANRWISESGIRSKIPYGGGTLGIAITVAQAQYPPAWMLDDGSLPDVGVVYDGNSCGDGLKMAEEECDDGNTISEDGCSNQCTIEKGFICTQDYGQPSVCTIKCGDGLAGGKESCDDGNTANGDGCSSECTVETGWSCVSELPTLPESVCTMCGDGMTLLGGSEGCDDGNFNDGDGCSQKCTVEVGWACTAATKNGIQLSNYHCSCATNHFGVDCSKFCSNSTTCNNHGYCDENGVCRCDPQWLGTNCDVFGKVEAAVVIESGPQGGQIQTGNGFDIDIGAGALISTVNISMTVFAATNDVVSAQQSSTLKPVSSVAYFGPSGLQFSIPVTIGLKVAASGLTASDYDTLYVHTLEESSGKWVVVEGKQKRDPSNSRVSVDIMHFSKYAVMQVFPQVANLTTISSSSAASTNVLAANKIAIIASSIVAIVLLIVGFAYFFWKKKKAPDAALSKADKKVMAALRKRVYEEEEEYSIVDERVVEASSLPPLQTSGMGFPLNTFMPLFPTSPSVAAVAPQPLQSPRSSSSFAVASFEHYMDPSPTADVFGMNTPLGFPQTPPALSLNSPSGSNFPGNLMLTPPSIRRFPNVLMLPQQLQQQLPQLQSPLSPRQMQSPLQLHQQQQSPSSINSLSPADVEGSFIPGRIQNLAEE